MNAWREFLGQHGWKTYATAILALAAAVFALVHDGDTGRALEYLLYALGLVGVRGALARVIQSNNDAAVAVVKTGRRVVESNRREATQATQKKRGGRNEIENTRTHGLGD